MFVCLYVLLFTEYTRNTQKIWSISINSILRKGQTLKPKGATSDGAVDCYSFDGEVWGKVSRSIK